MAYLNFLKFLGRRILFQQSGAINYFKRMRDYYSAGIVKKGEIEKTKSIIGGFILYHLTTTLVVEYGIYKGLEQLVK